MQKITVLGNVGKSQLKTLADGTNVLNFGLAAHRKKGNEQVTTWYECSVWGERAQSLAPHIKEGTGLVVDGFPSAEAYLPRDSAEPKVSLRITVDDLHFTGFPRKDPPEEQAPA